MASPTQEDPKPPKESNNSPPHLLPNPTPSSDSPPIPTRKFNYPSFSALLEGVVKAANSAASSLQPPNPQHQNVSFKGQFGMSHQEALANVTAKAAQVQLPSESANSTPVASPYDKSGFSDIGLTKTPLPENKNNMEEGKKKSSSEQISKPGNGIAKTPNSDGYSWRKYGQKQVKRSGSFRSYYRCTHAGCHAKKKVQHADKFICIIGVDYKGDHNHDPPTKAKETGLKMRTSVAMPVSRTDSDALSAKKKLGDSDLSASGKVNEEVISVDDRSEPEKSNNCRRTTNRDAEEQHDKKPESVQWAIVQQTMPLREEPTRLANTNERTMTDVMKIASCGQKRRMKDRARAHSLNLQKTPKETKVVVHAAGDIGFSADGYRWRKYGQKMVKQNINSRSYYRCTSAGCPARKHVEKARDNSTATMVTYEGKHDHDQPVPKKPHTSPACSVNAPTERTADGKGTDKMVESARTLLSIGIELKSC